MRVPFCLLLVLVGCQERVSEPPSGSTPPPSAAMASAKAGAAPSTTPIPSRAPRPAASVAPAEDDPLKGKFTLEQALAGLRGEGELYALMRTSVGSLSCELWPDKAPNTVANFVGLARGLRPFKQDGKWLKKPLYDGSEFYSVIKNFAIEGGSPSATFNDEIGYFIGDEIWPDARHNERGLLCMRAFTPGKNGSQFMILDGATPQLDQSFTIFGKCGPLKVIDTLRNAPVEAARPKPAIKLRKLEIVRSKQRPT